MAAADWNRQATNLAAWTWAYLVNRVDVYGYCSGGDRWTGPAVRLRGKVELSLQQIESHFRGTACLGVHGISADNRCKWLAFDVDRHNDSVDADENWATTERIVYELQGAGLEPLIEDSNGDGGYHVWVLFSDPIPSELAYRLGKWIAKRANASGVEWFPKQSEVTPKKPCGNWLRLLGKHHRRDHWSRMYDADSEIWLEGEQAIRAILEAPLNEPNIVEDLRPVLPTLPPPPPPTRLNVLPPGNRPVCVIDLWNHSIRRCGDRNKGLLSLCRYWKAIELPEADAIRHGVAFVEHIPDHLTTSDLSGEEIEANVASVVQSVYAGEYPFDCWYFRSLGTPADPVACDLLACRFVKPKKVKAAPEGSGDAIVPAEVTDRMVQCA